MVVAETLRGRANLDVLRDDWDRLMKGGDREPSVSFEWTAALMESHIRKDDEMVFIVLRCARRVIGIIPIVIRPTRKFGQTFLRAFPISEFYNTHSDFLLGDDSEAVLEAFLDAMYQPGLRWDVFSMTRMLESQPLGFRLCTVLSRCGKQFEWKRERPSFFLRLDPTYESYLRRRSGSFRNALKRIERKLLERGRVEIRTQQDFHDIEQAYEALLSVEQRSWKQDHGTSIAAKPHQITFYRRLCSLMLEKEWLRLEFLYLNDRPVAYNLGLAVKDTYFYLKTSYGHSERPLSPATFLRARLVEHLIRERVKHFDFPGDPYEWESQWTDEVRWHHSLTLFRGTLKGLAYALYRRAICPSTAGGATHVTYVDPKALKP